MVVQRRVNPYAKAYSFGTDGNAALAGSPISSYRPMQSQSQRRRSRRRRGIVLPRWVYVTCLVALIFSMIISYTEMAGRRGTITKDISIQMQELEMANQRIVQLDMQLAEVDDEVRMRAIALNRLGMKEPTQEQVRRVPVPYVIEETQELVQDESTGGGFFRVFLSLFTKD